jgi:RNA polymerase sigma factor for flagellar operon FliA
VQNVAHRLKNRVPSHVDFEELNSVGMIGLIEALDRYDDTKGVPFRAYAEIRINGAMLDYLRKEDWVPRSIRKQMKLYQQGVQLLKEKEMERTDANLATVLGLSVGETRKLLFETQRRTVLSGEITAGGAEEMYVEEIIEDQDQDVLRDLISSENVQRLHQALEKLPSREREILEMYYFHGKNLKQIGQVFAITESRACQIRKSAVGLLQRKLENTSG